MQKKKSERVQKGIVSTNHWPQLWRRLHLAAKDTFWEYTKKTKVSGIWLLRENRTTGVTRWLWSCVLLNLFFVGVFLSLQLWLQFYSFPILNTISNDLPITKVPFPGVTICTPQVVNMERVRKFIKTIKIPAKYKLQDVIDGFDYLEAFTDQSWRPRVNSNFKAAYDVLRLNNVSLYEAAIAITGGCKDFVKHCYWGRHEFPCFQKHNFLRFTTTTSFLGPCCSFNYNPANTSYVPFSSNIFGMDGGLTIIGAEGVERNRSSGLIVLVHHPMDFVTENAAAVTLTTNSESFVEITPTVQSLSPEVLELSQNKRDCLTSDEVELGNYRQASCLLSCQMETIVTKCNCLPYHLPVLKKNIRACHLNDSLCYADNYEHFKNSKCSHCLPNCYDITYATLSYKTDLQLHNFSISRLYENRNFTKDSFIARVYLSKQVVSSIHKITVMSWIGLLSDLGGVFNLCLGLSVVSLVEFIYYCTYRYYAYYKIRGVLLQG